MKKLIILLLVFCVIFASGCEKANNPVFSASVLPSQNLQPSAPPTQVQQTAAVHSAQTSGAIAANPFFSSNNTQVNYKVLFLFNDADETEAALHINKITDLNNGTVYELKLDPIAGVPDDRLSLGYFCVQADKIIKSDPTKENLSILKSNKLPEGSTIVCQDKEIPDALGENDKGFHHYIVANGNQREYHSYNNQVSTGYYESFTWEKNKGLISYRSGFGAEKDSLELQLDNQ